MHSKTAWACALCALACLTAPVMAETLTYNYNIKVPAGNPVENLILYAAGNGQDNILVSPSTLAPLGAGSLSHTVDFDATSGLVFGTTAGLDKTHIVLFSNTDFAADSIGVKWSERFVAPSPRHNELITLLQNVHAGDLAALDTLTTFLRSENASAAAFDPDGAFAVTEFTIGNPIGIPEPASLSILALATAALGLRRRR